MSRSVLDMSMSVDGYIADPDDFLGGDDGERHRLVDEVTLLTYPLSSARARGCSRTPAT